MAIYEFEAVGFIEAEDRLEAWHKAKTMLNLKNMDIVKVVSKPIKEGFITDDDREQVTA